MFLLQNAAVVSICVYLCAAMLQLETAPALRLSIDRLVFADDA
jgi:hypothetical protein